MKALCGTNDAYQRHLKAGEEPCAPCLHAKADNMVAALSRRRQTATPVLQHRLVRVIPTPAGWQPVDDLGGAA